MGDVSGDGTAASATFEIPAGSEYSVTSYVPDPTPRQLRARGRAAPAGRRALHDARVREPLSRDEERDRPSPLRSRMRSCRPSASSGAWPSVSSPPGRRRSTTIVEGTPYERVLRLTRRPHRRRTDRLRGGLADPALPGLELHLRPGRRPRHDPLPAFLFRDRGGYCQQFAGAMALMLRMTRDPQPGRLRLRARRAGRRTAPTR